MLLLCSDGLTNMLEDREIFALSRRNTDPLSLGRALMAEALRREARDNVTIVSFPNNPGTFGGSHGYQYGQVFGHNPGRQV